MVKKESKAQIELFPELSIEEDYKKLKRSSVWELDTKLTFGKYKGKTIKEVVNSDWKGYNWLAWASKNIKWFRLSDAAFAYCKKKGIRYAAKHGSYLEPGTSEEGFLRATGLLGGPRGECAQLAYEEGLNVVDEDEFIDGEWGG
jgi:hypothetical protein